MALSKARKRAKTKRREFKNKIKNEVAAAKEIKISKAEIKMY
ncbi:hypothetical protein [Clostridium sp.]|nr:hypothetical protein [Clostridium sp.]